MLWIFKRRCAARRFWITDKLNPSKTGQWQLASYNYNVMIIVRITCKSLLRTGFSCNCIFSLRVRKPMEINYKSESREVSLNEIVFCTKFCAIRRFSIKIHEFEISRFLFFVLICYCKSCTQCVICIITCTRSLVYTSVFWQIPNI